MSAERDGPLQVSAAGILVAVAFTFGTPILALAALAISVKTGSRLLPCVVVPVPVALSATSCPAPVFWILGGLQGPLYGIVLGLATPVRKHRGVWIAVTALHAVATLVAMVATLR